MRSDLSLGRLLSSLRGETGYDTSVLKDLDSPRGRERRIRLAVLGPFACLVALDRGTLLPLAWLAIYFIWLELNARWTARLPAQVRGAPLRWFVASVLGDSAFYFLAVVYLVLQEETVLLLLAFAMAAGYMLNALTEHCEEPLLAAVDLLGALAGMIAFKVVLALQLGLGESALALACAAILYVYFAVSLVQTMRARQRLRLVQRRAAEIQRIEAVGRLVSGFARDFDRRLEELRKRLDAAEATDSDWHASDLIGEARAIAVDARRVVQRLAGFARITRLRPVAIDLVTLLEELRPSLRAVLPTRVSLEIRAFSVARLVLVDRRQLSAVLLELVTNARDALGEHGHIRIETRDATFADGAALGPDRTLPPGAYVRLSVVDDGPGLPDEVIERAGEPYPSDTRLQSKSGLGLSMTFGFAEQSGGGAEIASTPGRGTRVSLLLPAHRHHRA